MDLLSTTRATKGLGLEVQESLGAPSTCVVWTPAVRSVLGRPLCREDALGRLRAGPEFEIDVYTSRVADGPQRLRRRHQNGLPKGEQEQGLCHDTQRHVNGRANDPRTAFGLGT